MLGALLLSSEVHYHYVIEVGLRAEDFYREKHRLIYESIQALFDESEPIDVVTVTEHLKSRGKLDLVGGGTEIDASDQASIEMLDNPTNNAATGGPTTT